MGLTSCRWITIAKMLAHRRERAADRYTLICDGPDKPSLGRRLQVSGKETCSLYPSALVCSAEDRLDIEDGGTVDRFEAAYGDGVFLDGLYSDGVQAYGVGAVW